MIHSRRRPARHPKHARPSVLAPTRALAVVAGFGVLTVAIVAGCAASAQKNDAAAPRRAAPPAAVAAPAVDGSVFVNDAAGLAAPAASGVLLPGVGTSAPAVVAAPGGTTTRLGDGAPAPDAAPVSGLAASGIPSTALSAYRAAAAREAARRPACGITWALLAGIGRVESNHGRFAGAELHADGVSTPRIIGIPLNGNGTALIRDTDGGRLDGDTVYDRAVGPMQFIPSTWASWGVDANGDGLKDPFNVFDAAAAAADYLCAAGRNLTTSSGQVQAILSYNYSYDYVSMVMGLERVYAGQTGETVPVLPTSPEPRHGRPVQKPPLPPVDPGTPGGVRQPTNPRLPVKVLPSSAPATSSSAKPAPSSSAPSSSPSSSSTPAPTSSSASPSCPVPSETSSSSTPDPATSSAATPDPCSTASSASSSAPSADASTDAPPTDPAPSSSVGTSP